MSLDPIVTGHIARLLTVEQLVDLFELRHQRTINPVPKTLLRGKIRTGIPPKSLCDIHKTTIRSRKLRAGIFSL